jgi:mono/diheme cytochrome c family protein
MFDKFRYAALLAMVCAMTGMVAAALAATPEVTTAYSGDALYMANCANCHGPHGEGSGRIAADLDKTPPDLRHLASANGGVFPRQQITDIIDGRAIVKAHGDREMPVWGQAFTMLDTGATSNADAEARTQAKILVLVDFLERIQQK